MTHLLALLLAISGLDGLSRSRGTPTPPLNVTAMTEQADVVLLGTVVRITNTGYGYLHANGPARVEVARAEIRVHHVLKGSLDSPTLEVDFEISFDLAYGSVEPNESGLFSLTRDDATYRFVNPYDPVVIANTEGPIHGTTVIDKVATAIAGVLRAPASSRDQKRRAIQTLFTVKSEVAIRELRRALTEHDDEVRYTAAGVLILLDDLVGLSAVKDVLLRAEPALSLERIHSLRSAVGMGISNRRASSTLVELLQSDIVENRRAASEALGRTNDRRVIPVLARALDDLDRKVRANAVRSLARITGDLAWLPSEMSLADNEAKYLTYWRQRISSQ